jgi:hypothetical protein
LTPSEGAGLGIPVLRSEICFDGVDWRTPTDAGDTISQVSTQTRVDDSVEAQSIAIAVGHKDGDTPFNERHLSVVVLTGAALDIAFE